MEEQSSTEFQEEAAGSTTFMSEVIDGAQDNTPDITDQPETPTSSVNDELEALPETSDLVVVPEAKGEMKKTYDKEALRSLSNQQFSLDHAKPLDAMTFPDQPRPGSNQMPGTLANIRHLLRGYGILVRYNIINKKLEIILPGHSGTTDNFDNVAMTYIISLAVLNGLPLGQVYPYIEALADRNLYNPVAEHINSKPWDGVDRLPDLYDTVTAQEGYPLHFKNILVYKWLLSAVAAALMPVGFKARGVLTFQGAQGLGKTTWLLSLVPDLLLREAVVKVDHHMDGGNKDSILGAICHWLVEIGELDSSFRKDVSRLKGFLTSDYDKIRRPYSRKESEYPRRTVFFASVNTSDFLVDNTGNSRWWTVPVTSINYQHGIDMQQVFAQLAVDFHNGAEWWLTKDEEFELNYRNSDHRSVSVIRERILEIVDLELKGGSGHPAMSSIQVLTELGYDKPTNPQCKECAGILRELFGEPKKIKGIMKWRVPLRRTKAVAHTPINNDDDF